MASFSTRIQSTRIFKFDLYFYHPNPETTEGGERSGNPRHPDPVKNLIRNPDSCQNKNDTQESDKITVIIKFDKFPTKSK